MSAPADTNRPASPAESDEALAIGYALDGNPSSSAPRLGYRYALTDSSRAALAAYHARTGSASPSPRHS